MIQEKISGDKIQCRADETILSAVMRSGCKWLTVGCFGGGCGICKIRVCTGKYVTRKMSKAHLSLEEEKTGCCLACATLPRSNLVIEVIIRSSKWQLNTYYGRD